MSAGIARDLPAGLVINVIGAEVVLIILYLYLFRAALAQTTLWKRFIRWIQK